MYRRRLNRDRSLGITGYVVDRICSVVDRDVASSIGSDDWSRGR